jgi:hypothetical protein
MSGLIRGAVKPEIEGGRGRTPRRMAVATNPSPDPVTEQSTTPVLYWLLSAPQQTWMRAVTCCS